MLPKKYLEKFAALCKYSERRWTETFTNSDATAAPGATATSETISSNRSVIVFLRLKFNKYDVKTLCIATTGYHGSA